MISCGAIATAVFLTVMPDFGPFEQYARPHPVTPPPPQQRILLLDVGRKYMSLPMLRQQVATMQRYGFNQLHLHLSDNEGLRLESAVHPEIETAAPFYTKQEMREFDAYAAASGVTVVPEIDFPSHTGKLLATHPSLALAGVSNVINLGNPQSFVLMGDILHEYLPVFSGRYWHLGADEYPPTASHADFLNLIAWAHDQVMRSGKLLRIWNDGLWAADEVTKDITIDYWWPSRVTPAALSDAGYHIVNASYYPGYLVLGGYRATDAELRAWTPLALAPHVAGFQISVWCDTPNAETEAQISNDVARMLADVSPLVAGPEHFVKSLDNGVTKEYNVHSRKRATRGR